MSDNTLRVPKAKEMDDDEAAVETVVTISASDHEQPSLTVPPGVAENKRVLRPGGHSQ